MSFEGYYRKLCVNGHLTQEDVYYTPREHDGEWLCPHCQSKEVWGDMVDCTNEEPVFGPDAENPELEQLTEPTGDICNFGHSHIAEPATYEIPTKHRSAVVYATIRLDLLLDVEDDGLDVAESVLKDIDFGKYSRYVSVLEGFSVLRTELKEIKE